MNATANTFLSEWKEECCKWQGGILKGRYSHYCWDWDGLPVDETCSEFTQGCCNCFTQDELMDKNFKTKIGKAIE